MLSLSLSFCLSAQAAGTATAQVVHAQQRTVPAAAAPAEVAAIATGHVVRAVTPATASAVVTTNLTPVQTQTRSLVTPGTPCVHTVVKSVRQLLLIHSFSKNCCQTSNWNVFCSYDFSEAIYIRKEMVIVLSMF